MSKGSFEVKVGLGEMLKGGVIMDVTDSKQAKIAEDAGAVAVMALERIPADIRADGGIARMSDPSMIKEICEDLMNFENLSETAMVRWWNVHDTLKAATTK